MADWSCLPHDLLVFTARLLKKFDDFAAFGTVCKTWHAAANKDLFKELWSQERTPYLLLPARSRRKGIRDLYSWSEGNVVASIRVPNSSQAKCFESLGWLLAVGKDRSMCLLDPFSSSKVDIPLPPQSTLDIYAHPCEFVVKMVLSARPDESSDFVVAIIYRCMLDLAFWWPGETSWHVVKIGQGFLQDVTYHSGQFYSIDSVSKIRIHRLVEGQLTASVVAVHKQRLVPLGFCAIGEQRCKYLTKADEDSLLVVIRTYDEYNAGGTYVNSDEYDTDEEKDDEDDSDEEKDDQDNSADDDYDDDDSDKGEYRGHYIKTSRFEVYEFNFPRGKWRKIDNLGNMAIFVSNVNATTAVDASRFPTGVVKPNHIYFMDDGQPYEGDSHLDRGAYNMENKTIDPFCHEEEFHSKRSRPTWFIPIMWPLSH